MDPVTDKNDFRHLQNLSSSGDETSAGIASLPHPANAINQIFLAQMNAFQPLVSDHEFRNLAATTNHLPFTINCHRIANFQEIIHHLPQIAFLVGF